jgi:uncharacterized membrane protein
MQKYQKNWLKFSVGLVLCLLVRLIPFRPPNIEPILATNMPFSKAYGPYAGFLFAFVSIVLYDVVTSTLGMWSLITASTYGVIGFASFFYFQKYKASALGYAGFAVIGTLFFDAVTGLSIGPLFFNQSFQGALWGQIPFTLWHLMGNISFALILSPAIYKSIIENKKLDNISFIKIFKPIKA